MYSYNFHLSATKNVPILEYPPVQHSSNEIEMKAKGAGQKETGETVTDRTGC